LSVSMQVSARDVKHLRDPQPDYEVGVASV